MFCHHCGTAVAPDTKFCQSCGQALGAQATPGGPAPTPPSAAPFTPSGEVKARTGAWISEGWAIVKSDMGTFALMSLVMVVLSSSVPVILQGPLTAGFQVAILHRILRGRVEFGDLFKGFNFFLPAMLASLVMAAFTFLGMLACLIPALVVQAMYFFTYLFIVDRKMEFWPAMQASHQIVKNDYFGFTLLLLAFIGLHILGALCCLVGLLWTIPLQYAAITIAYKEIVGFQSPSID